MNRILKLYNNNLSIWVVLFSIIAYLYPPLFKGLDPFIIIFFAITMFGIGLVITQENYQNIVRSPGAILYGNLCQFTIMPLLGLATAYIFDLPKAITVGMVLTGAAPGAMTSNLISYLSDGDTAYSVSLTAVATLICPFLTPLLTLFLAGKMLPIPFWDMVGTIIYAVVIPLFVGYQISKNFPQFLEKVKEVPPTISVTAIIVICSCVVAVNKDNLGKTTLIIFIAVVVHNIVGLTLGYLAGKAGRFNFKRKKTLSIEIGMQNAGLGAVLALKHFPKEVAIPAAIFTIWCIISASLLVSFWKFVETRSANRIEEK